MSVRAAPIVGLAASARRRAVARSIGCSSNGSGMENGAGTVERSSARDDRLPRLRRRRSRSR